MRYERRATKGGYTNTEKRSFRVKEVIPTQNFSGRSVQDVLGSIEGVTEIGYLTQTSPVKNKLGGIFYSCDRMMSVRPELMYKRISDKSTYRVLEAKDGKRILQTDAFGDTATLRNKITAGEHYLNGEKHLRERNWNEAIHSFDTAMMYDSEYVQPFFDKAYCQYKMGATPEEVLSGVTTFSTFFSDLHDLQSHNHAILIYANKEVSPVAGVLRDVSKEESKRRDESAYFFRKLFAGIAQRMKDEHQKKKEVNPQPEKETVTIVRDITSKINFSGKSVEDILRGVEESTRIGVPTHLPSSAKLLTISKIQEISYISLERITKARPDLMHKKNHDGSVYKIVEMSDGTMALITDVWGDIAGLEQKIQAEEYYSLGDHAAKKGLWDKASEYFDAAIDMDSAYAKPFLGRAYCKHRIGAYKAAIDDTLTYNNLFHGSYRGYKLLGRCYIALGEYQKAMKHLEIALKNLDNWNLATKEEERDELQNLIESMRQKQEVEQFEKSLDEFRRVGNERSLGDIKKMYRNLALRYHPDKVVDKTNKNALTIATERIQQINDVYDQITAKK